MEAQAGSSQRIRGQRSQRRVRNREAYVSTWTTFHASQEFSIHAVQPSELTQFSFLKYLFSSLGHEISSWGRLSSSQDFVLLITFWRSPTDLENFLRSDIYEKYQEGFRALNNGAEPAVLRASYPSVIGARALRYVDGLPVTIRKVRFPLSLSAEQKEAVSRLEGLDYHGKFFFGGNPFLRTTSWQLWFVCDTELIFMCCYFWRNEQSERESLDWRVDIIEKRAGHGVLVGTERAIDRWDRQLREIGAFGIEDEKIELRKLQAFEPKEANPWLDENGEIVCSNETAEDCAKNRNPYCFINRRCNW